MTASPEPTPADDLLQDPPDLSNRDRRTAPVLAFPPASTAPGPSRPPEQPDLFSHAGGQPSEPERQAPRFVPAQPQGLLATVCQQLDRMGVRLPRRPRLVGRFGDTAAACRQLTAAVLDGRKRAASSLLWSWQDQGIEPPDNNDVEIIIDWEQRPVAAIIYHPPVIRPFREVEADHAAAEGEGDGSLGQWRLEHWPFFARECERLGRQPDENMPVLCARFELLDQFDPGQARG